MLQFMSGVILLSPIFLMAAICRWLWLTNWAGRLFLSSSLLLLSLEFRAELFPKEPLKIRYERSLL